MSYLEKIFKSINYDYNLLIKNINLLCQRYPFLRKKSIGKSVRGRDIPSITLGNSDNYCLFAAAVHGSEHITSNVILMWLEELCQSITDGTSFCGLKIQETIMERGIIVVPRVNPDGCEISIHGANACGKYIKEITRMSKGDFLHFNANFRGVDINHNFDAGWEELKKKEENMGIHFPSSTRFGGYKKMSEPETLALTNLCKTENIRNAIALHSQGKVIYWTYGNNRPKSSRQIAEIMAKTSGYALDVAFGIADGGGFKDWFIKEFNRPAFTVELGFGENPLPIETANDIYEEVKKMFTITSIL